MEENSSPINRHFRYVAQNHIFKPFTHWHSSHSSINWLLHTVIHSNIYWAPVICKTLESEVKEDITTSALKDLMLKLRRQRSAKGPRQERTYGKLGASDQRKWWSWVLKILVGVSETKREGIGPLQINEKQHGRKHQGCCYNPATCSWKGTSVWSQHGVFNLTFNVFMHKRHSFYCSLLPYTWVFTHACYSPGL